MKKINNTNIKISIALNILIVIMTVVALAIALSGFKFMKGYETPGELTGLQAFGYFTVQSNVFMAIVSFAFAIKELPQIFCDSCIVLFRCSFDKSSKTHLCILIFVHHTIYKI